jgi:hypothetical protein
LEHNPKKVHPFRFKIRDIALKKLVQKVIARIPIETEKLPVFGTIETEIIGGVRRGVMLMVQN